MKSLVLGPFASFVTLIAHEAHHLIIMSKNICSFRSIVIKHMVKMEGVISENQGSYITIHKQQGWYMDEMLLY
jgi:hypothetical protein